MENSNNLHLEKEINCFITQELKKKSPFVLTEFRIHPAELDIVFFNRETLQLTNIEIKRNNWKKVLLQAKRGKLYCHYSIAVLPIAYKERVPYESFEDVGVGLMFYEVKRDRILNLMTAVHPKLSDTINRGFKRLIYNQLTLTFGELIYA